MSGAGGCLHKTLVSQPVTAENEMPDHLCADCGASVISAYDNYLEEVYGDG